MREITHVLPSSIAWRIKVELYFGVGEEASFTFGESIPVHLTGRDGDK